MFWMMLGVLAGFGAGLYALVRILEARPGLQETRTLLLLIAIGLLGTGLIGGGYLVQWLISKYEKRKRNRQRADTKQEKSGKKKKRK